MTLSEMYFPNHFNIILCFSGTWKAHAFVSNHIGIGRYGYFHNHRCPTFHCNGLPGTDYAEEMSKATGYWGDVWIYNDGENVGADDDWANDLKDDGKLQDYGGESWKLAKDGLRLKCVNYKGIPLKQEGNSLKYRPPQVTSI